MGNDPESQERVIVVVTHATSHSSGPLRVSLTFLYGKQS